MGRLDEELLALELQELNEADFDLWTVIDASSRSRLDASSQCTLLSMRQCSAGHFGLCYFRPKSAAPKTIAESVEGPLRMVEGHFLSVAEAMPESKYAFTPTAGKFDGVRSFAEQGS